LLIAVLHFNLNREVDSFSIAGAVFDLAFER